MRVCALNKEMLPRMDAGRRVASARLVERIHCHDQPPLGLPLMLAPTKPIDAGAERDVDVAKVARQRRDKSFEHKDCIFPHGDGAPESANGNRSKIT